jgi:hypothetical protein
MNMATRHVHDPLTKSLLSGITKKILKNLEQQVSIDLEPNNCLQSATDIQ